MSTDSFDTRRRLQIDGTTYRIHRLDRIKTAHRPPYTFKVLLENLLRNEDENTASIPACGFEAECSPNAASVAHSQVVQFYGSRRERLLRQLHPMERMAPLLSEACVEILVAFQPCAAPMR